VTHSYPTRRSPPRRRRLGYRGTESGPARTEETIGHISTDSGPVRVRATSAARRSLLLRSHLAVAIAGMARSCSRCLNSIDGGKPIESVPTGGYRSMRHLAPPTLGSASQLASLAACVHGCNDRLLSTYRTDDKNQRLLMDRPVRRVGQTEKGLRMRSPWRFIGVSWRDRSVESRRAGSVSLGP
jgi:hypothetical protein